MIVYLAGAINRCSDSEAKDWRQAFIAANPEVTALDPMRRDYRGIEDENVNEIVQLDIEDIQQCDVFLANCAKPSWGTAMEIRIAHDLGKRIIAVVPSGDISPWLQFHASEVVTVISEVVL